ncbi:hypothetical protein pdam_00007363 [Pocillopora damicornis]|uniref:Prenylcysteine lyase domain-containing protein n=1 Tax=Pocillopora damicornis TaxID=46731 RepID=A0A3M6V5S9_POCDA|nr:hypothetical protein pdam_00007363 [Pocillopora damicornis]
MFRTLGFGISTSILLIPALFLDRQRCTVSAAEKNAKPNIAIIGAGIGGSSAAHFIRQLFGPEATIDVYEASDRIGGRLSTVEIAGKRFESGGSIIHKSNKYMADFVEYLELKKLKSSEPNSLLGIYNGEEFQTTRQTLENIGLNQLLIDELVTVVMRINYGQDVTLNGFAGGNWKVCDGLLSSSNATVYKNTKISEIVKRSQGSSVCPVYTLKSDSQIPDQHYDVVIVAAPLEIADYYFDCKDCNNWPTPKDLGEFWRTIATFIHGQVNMNHFGFSTEDDIPEVIGTTETPTNFFNSIGKQEPVENRTEIDPKELPINKIFSRSNLTALQLNKLFSRVDEMKVVSWLAYPHFTPPEKFWSFVLDDGVFFVNAIEYSASAMEMSAVSAKNAALLAHHYYSGKLSDAHINDKPSNLRSEL